MSVKVLKIDLRGKFERELSRCGIYNRASQSEPHMHGFRTELCHTKKSLSINNRLIFPWLIFSLLTVVECLSCNIQCMLVFIVLVIFSSCSNFGYASFLFFIIRHHLISSRYSFIFFLMKTGALSSVQAQTKYSLISFIVNRQLY